MVRQHEVIVEPMGACTPHISGDNTRPFKFWLLRRCFSVIMSYNYFMADPYRPGPSHRDSPALMQIECREDDRLRWSQTSLRASLTLFVSATGGPTGV